MNGVKLKDLEIIVPTTKEVRQPKPNGFSLFPQYHAFCCLLLGMRHSGKSTAIYNILARTLSYRDIVFIFCSTVDTDKSWQPIKNLLNEYGVEFVCDSSPFGKQAGVKYDHVADILNNFEGNPELLKNRRLFCIFDDMPKKFLRHESVENLIKRGRHINCNIIISTQSFADLSPPERMNLEYLFVFKNIPRAKIEKLYEDLSITEVSSDRFQHYYSEITRDDGLSKHNFMYIGRNPFVIRKNLNIQYNISRSGEEKTDTDSE